MESAFKTLRLGSSGMRGIVGAGLDPAHAIDFAAALGTMKPGGRILLARDTRKSSAMLRCAAAAGLSGCGCEVIDGGILPAGAAHYLIAAQKLDGGILISGGHQALGWNSLIPLSASGAYFNAIERRELLDIYFGKHFTMAAFNELRPEALPPPDFEEQYLAALERSVDARAIRAANFTVVGDFCNGAGSFLAERWAEFFNIRLLAINEQADGEPSRDPEPRPRNGSVIAGVIVPLGGDIGFVFNSDMSRMEIVTERGEPLTEELTCALGIDHRLSLARNNRLVATNVCTTRTLDDAVAARGGKLERCPVGQAHVIDAMWSSGATLGGEGSGSFACSPEIRGFDGFLMALVLLESMALQNKTCGELVAALHRYQIVKTSVESPAQHGYNAIRKLTELFPDAACSELDGLRFDWADGWISLRISNTEPVLRILSEADSKEKALERVWAVKARLENLE